MKILMVCLGNICRSPLAHGILEKLAKEKGLDWQVDSAGTGNWHIGSPPDHRSVAVARRHGLDISRQVCRQFTYRDFSEFDRIYAMDFDIRDTLLCKAKNEHDRKKISLFLPEAEVPDPYTDDTMFEPVYQMIAKRCEEIIAEGVK